MLTTLFSTIAMFARRSSSSIDLGPEGFIVILVVAGIVAIIQLIQHSREQDAKQEEYAGMITQAVAWSRQTKRIFKPISKSGLPVQFEINEQPYHAVSCSLYETRAVRTSVGAGVSLRVAKGVYLHPGAGRSKSHEEWTNICDGTLIITTKRIIFIGDKCSRIIPLKKLVSATANTPDQLLVSSSTRQKSMVFVGSNAIISSKIVNYVCNISK